MTEMIDQAWLHNSRWWWYVFSASSSSLLPPFTLLHLTTGYTLIRKISLHAQMWICCNPCSCIFWVPHLSIDGIELGQHVRNTFAPQFPQIDSAPSKIIAIATSSWPFWVVKTANVCSVETLRHGKTERIARVPGRLRFWESWTRKIAITYWVFTITLSSNECRILPFSSLEEMPVGRWVFSSLLLRVSSFLFYGWEYTPPSSTP